ncbi:TraR/DksA family transcriptional regulator [Streptomyces sp. NPDC052052]|uniref:TraR/DksA family transcriptional regulator n=1 Tax=Streptomyces sp. NPDC052052 TaxID=3154756 RepID=UPI003446DB0A
MVAKKSAAKKSEPAGSTGAAAGKAGTRDGPGTDSGAAATKKTAARRSAARERAAPTEHAVRSRKSPAKKNADKKASKKAAEAATVAAEAAEQTGVTRVVAKKSTARTRMADEGAAPASAAGGVTAAAPGELAVRPGEDPWTPQEVDEAHAVLSSEVVRLRSELEAAEAALAGLMRDSGDGAGDDEADTGTKNITREHEMSLAANAQEMLDQTERALARLDAGTYGLCEACGNPIGKARMQAFPRATLCVEDKQKQERRG